MHCQRCRQRTAHHMTDVGQQFFQSGFQCVTFFRCTAVAYQQVIGTTGALSSVLGDQFDQIGLDRFAAADLGSRSNDAVVVKGQDGLNIQQTTHYSSSTADASATLKILHRIDGKKDLVSVDELRNNLQKLRKRHTFGGIHSSTQGEITHAYAAAFGIEYTNIQTIVTLRSKTQQV